jgi:DNA-binding transcriptional MerR regulator
MTNLNRLPDEIKKSARFFAVGTASNPKAPKVNDWSNPENQTNFEMIDGAAGFDTCGHDKGADYLFLDFDHVLNDDGEFVTDTAAATVADLQATFPNIYIEKSISKHGLHAFLIPTSDKFNAFNAGSKGTIYFSDSREKDAPKLELFYKSKARYCLVTGNLFSTGADVPSGEPADNYLNKILAIVASQTKRDSEIKSIVKEVTNADTPPEYHRDLAVELWQFGNLADAGRGDWLPCISALKNLGFSLSEVKSMCEHSTRYDENAFDAEFESLTDISNFGIETLIGKCRNFDFKEFARKWYSEHPQFKSNFRRSNNDNDEIQSLFEELQEVENKIAEFDAEKNQAIEDLSNVITFDTETVFSENVLTAAAFLNLKLLFRNSKKPTKKTASHFPTLARQLMTL